MKHFGCLFFLALFLVGFPAESSAQTLNYALLREQIAKAYPQQAEEMTQALSVLQHLSEETISVLSKIDAKCGQ